MKCQIFELKNNNTLLYPLLVSDFGQKRNWSKVMPCRKIIIKVNCSVELYQTYRKLSFNLRNFPRCHSHLSIFPIQFFFLNTKLYYYNLLVKYHIIIFYLSLFSSFIIPLLIAYWQSSSHVLRQLLL